MENIKQTKPNVYANNNSKQHQVSSLNLYTPTYVGLLMFNFFGGEAYCITFIDDFSPYDYVYLLHEKCQLVDALEVFINEIERQLDRNVKIVRFDKGGEYCGKHVEIGQSTDLFAKFLEKRGICA